MDKEFSTAPRWFAQILKAENFVLKRTHKFLPKQADLHNQDNKGTSDFSYNKDLDLLAAERMVPGNNASPYMVQHVARYLWAMSIVRGESVVDLGCGDGYGTHLLSWVSPEVYGVDLDLQAIQEAWKEYGSKESFQKLSAREQVEIFNDSEIAEWRKHEMGSNPTAPVYKIADLTKSQELPAVRYGVCFEVMEHLKNPQEILQSIADSNIQEVLFSIPNPLAGGSHINPHHINDWSLGLFKSYLKEAGAKEIKQYHQGLKRYQVKRGAFYWDLNWLFEVRFR